MEAHCALGCGYDLPISLLQDAPRLHSTLWLKDTKTPEWRERLNEEIHKVFSVLGKILLVSSF